MVRILGLAVHGAFREKSFLCVNHLVGDREALPVAVLRVIRKVVGDVSGRGYIGQSSVI